MAALQHPLQQKPAEPDAPDRDEERVDERADKAVGGAKGEGEPGEEDEVGGARDVGDCVCGQLDGDMLEDGVGLRRS